MPENKKKSSFSSNNNNAFSGDDKLKRPKRPVKKKICEFCKEKLAGDVDYKEVGKLRRYVTEKGKMIPRRASGNCAKHQRQLENAIKRARIMALMAFKAE